MNQLVSFYIAFMGVEFRWENSVPIRVGRVGCVRCIGMVRRVVLNCCYGGFGLSEEAISLYHHLTTGISETDDRLYFFDIQRDDPILLQIIDTIGLEVASGPFCKLGIVEIPDDIPTDGWIVMDYDGREWVAEVHRTWAPS